MSLAAAGNVLYAAGHNVILSLDISKGATVLRGSPARAEFCAGSVILHGEKLWLADDCSNSLQVFDLRAARFENPIPLGGEPTSMAFDGSHLWVSIVSKKVVQVVNPAKGFVVNEIAIRENFGPITFDGKRIWVATAENLQAFDPGTGQVLFTVSDYNIRDVSQLESGITDGGFPTDLIFAAGRLWVGSSRSSVLSIDPETRKVEQIDLGAGRKLFAFDGSRLWVGNRGRNTLRAIDMRNLSVGRPVNIGAELSTMVFDGKRLWLGYDGGKVVQPVTVR